MSTPVDTRPGVAGHLPAPWADYVGGARAMVPWLLGVVPFGLVIGVSAARADVPGLAGWLGGPLLFGESAHVATLHLLDAHAAAAVGLAPGRRPPAGCWWARPLPAAGAPTRPSATGRGPIATISVARSCWGP